MDATLAIHIRFPTLQLPHTHFGQQRSPFLSLLFGYIDVTLRLADDSHTTDGYDLIGLCAVVEQCVLLPDVSRLHVFGDGEDDGNDVASLLFLKTAFHCLSFSIVFLA
jgi:hypothetical protein